MQWLRCIPPPCLALSGDGAGSLTPILMLVRQAAYQLSHLPSQPLHNIFNMPAFSTTTRNMKSIAEFGTCSDTLVLKMFETQ